MKKRNYNHPELTMIAVDLKSDILSSSIQLYDGDEGDSSLDRVVWR